MLLRLQAAGIPAALSHSAGTFVCNQVFFGLVHYLATHKPHARGGFVHVPYLPQQAARHDNAPSMALPTMVEAIRLCIETALASDDDVHYASGSID
jgi:pyroglutamyl-peptidase